MPNPTPQTVAQSRSKLLATLAAAQQITFVRAYGNQGDQLIYAGTRQLLAQTPFSEISIRDLQGQNGDTALLSGSGGWCRPYHDMPKYLPLLEKRFRQIIVLPSSFDTSVPCVRDALTQTRAKVFAREEESYQAIRNLCDADLAHDCAFFFDYRPYHRAGHGTLNAFRQDKESAGHPLPENNNDISVTCDSLDEWLWTIARHQTIKTDRAHVTIAAALLGKQVEFRPSSYHKLPAIVRFSLPGYPISQSTPPPRPPTQQNRTPDPRKPEWQGKAGWVQRLQKTALELSALLPHNTRFLLVDEDQLRPYLAESSRAVPFLERDGQYWGPPYDDTSAIQEFEWLRKQGLETIVFAWPAFWWLDHYAGFTRHLQTRFPQVHHSQNLLAFDIRPHPGQILSQPASSTPHQPPA